jgi:hypothetical protein
MTSVLVRGVKRVFVCWRRGHLPWSDALDDPWCDRCGAQLGARRMESLLVEVHEPMTRLD